MYSLHLLFLIHLMALTSADTAVKWAIEAFNIQPKDGYGYFNFEFSTTAVPVGSSIYIMTAGCGRCFIETSIMVLCSLSIILGHTA
jgi:hypothetical protein